MLGYELNYYQLSLTLLSLIISYMLILVIGVKQKKEIAIVSFIFVWHTFFSIYYYSYTLSNVADAVGYYKQSLAGDYISSLRPAGLPTLISTIFSSGIGANYLNTALAFNLIGTIGLLLFYHSIKDLGVYLTKYWFLILFIPSMSFWSAGLGKDAISFFAICLLLYSFSSNKKQAVLLPLSFFAMFMVRPHIALVMLVSFVVYFILRSKIHLIFKLLTLPFLALSAIVLINFVQNYVGIEEASLEGLGSYIDQRQDYNTSGGSSLDIASMSYPMQMFTYIFRPLPFEAHSIVALITSIENTILLLGIAYILLKSKFNFRPWLAGKNLLFTVYFIFCCSILATTTANLGIATRQKWMFMPILIYLLVYSFHEYKVKNNKVYS